MHGGDSARALKKSRADAAMSKTSRPPCALATKLTRTGPRIWPMANADVIIAIRLTGLAGAILRASCIAANVMTMNVPPTHKDESTIPAILGHTTGTATPIDINT